jgi:hypothetical protein
LNRNELLFGDVQMFDRFRLEMAFIEISETRVGVNGLGKETKGQMNSLSRLMNRSVKKVDCGSGTGGGLWGENWQRVGNLNLRRICLRICADIWEIESSEMIRD